jgi:hypothetical protein
MVLAGMYTFPPVKLRPNKGTQTLLVLVSASQTVGITGQISSLAVRQSRASLSNGEGDRASARDGSESIRSDSILLRGLAWEATPNPGSLGVNRERQGHDSIHAGVRGFPACLVVLPNII